MADGPADGTARPTPERVRRPLPDHPVRLALLDLLAETGTATATGAAARLGLSSGLCSFHLRQLARYGLVEEVPTRAGRSRPWRLRWGSPDQPSAHPAPVAHRADPLAPVAHRADPLAAVLHLTPGEAAELADTVRELFDAYARRTPPPAGAVPYAVAARVLPLLPG
ncbi:winged helix-turn-helix domain-containing protein [Kitasatospora sp. NPDC057198]|uniref:winged helix-turn-helix domain-containing protein n=1 Tax=Kitasatospora sp. NPDC057198 TaxID=3346046 RepID=UPI003645A9CD